MSIFISYRRGDAAGHAQNLHHRLCGWFDGGSELFFDVDTIRPGEPFPQRIADAIDAAAVVLVLIGPGWLDEINRRAGLPGEVDFVRHEVERALARSQAGDSVRVIPVLLGGVGMPSVSGLADALRPSLSALCALDAHAFAGGKLDDWEHQFVRLRQLIAAVPAAPRERFRDRSGSPRPWRVVDHALSAHFQDPNSMLAALRTQLQGGGAAAVVGAGGARTHAAALHGMGGIGKTQLALAYSHAYRDTYAGVWWLRAESSGGHQGGGDTLLQQDALAACAAAGVAVLDGELPSSVFKRWLGGQSAPWLLVFDNADDPAALRRHLPEPGAHHVVITSRRPDWGNLAKTVELQTWTPQQGADFLVQRLGHQAASADAEVLAREMGGLPLALEQAASYVQSAGGTVGEYLALWREAAAELLRENVGSSGYEHTVAASLSLAFEKLSPAAQQLLRLCAFAAPDPLPERFFTERPDELPEELRAAAASKLAWSRVASELESYALVQREAIASLDRTWQAGGRAPEGTPTEMALTMHRLTQQVVRDRLADVPGDDMALLVVLERGCPDDVQNPAQWPRLAALLPHAVWVNDEGPIAAFEEPALASSRTWLLDRIAGFMQFGLALYAQARARFEQAHAISGRVLGKEHPNTLGVMGNLAGVLRAQGDLAGARSLQEQALSIHRRLLGEEHLATLTSMSNLANTLWTQGDLASARSLEEQVLAISRRVHGEAHPATLTSMNNLASTLWTQGDLAGARSLQEQVLALHRRVQSEEHPDTLTSMNNLASTLGAQGDLGGARSLEEHALTIRRRVLGEEHPDTLTSMNNLADTLRAQGDLVGARSLQDQVLVISRRVLGEEHLDTLRSMNNLANTLRAQGDLGGARSLEEQALTIRRRMLGEEHPDTLTSMSNLADTLGAQGDLGGARSLQDQVLTLRRHVLGREHPDTLTSMNNLAGTLRAQGDLVGARNLQDQTLAIRRRVLGEDHPATLMSINNLAVTCFYQGDRELAAELMEHAAKGRNTTLGADHPETQSSMRSLIAMRQAAKG